MLPAADFLPNLDEDWQSEGIYRRRHTMKRLIEATQFRWPIRMCARYYYLNVRCLERKAANCALLRPTATVWRWCAHAAGGVPFTCATSSVIVPRKGVIELDAYARRR